MYIYYKWPNNLNFTHLKVTLHFTYGFLQLRGREREREYIDFYWYKFQPALAIFFCLIQSALNVGQYLTACKKH